MFIAWIYPISCKEESWYFSSS